MVYDADRVHIRYEVNVLCTTMSFCNINVNQMKKDSHCQYYATRTKSNSKLVEINIKLV